jgi:prepilin-type N-terminal cleavage/methylation domain-containing protein
LGTKVTINFAVSLPYIEAGIHPPCAGHFFKQRQWLLAYIDHSGIEPKVKTLKSKAGFSITELAVVLAIILIVSGLSLPSISRTIDNARLIAAAQQLAGMYEQGRMRATQDNNYYTLLVSPPAAKPAQVCIDLDGDAACGPNDPQILLPNSVSLNNNAIPVLLDSNTLGFTPLRTETSSTFSSQGNVENGLAWNARGLPCQRLSSTSPCSNSVSALGAAAGPVGWVQYLQLQRGADVFYAAVTVNPSGRIRIWKYAPGGNTSWY